MLGAAINYAGNRDWMNKSDFLFAGWICGWSGAFGSSGFALTPMVIRPKLSVSVHTEKTKGRSIAARWFGSNAPNLIWSLGDFATK